MEGPLFNPGFLGGKFLWFVGQVADDSTWRENQNPAKNEGAEDVPGWGYRYKIRIIGLHDQGEEEIESEDLPWAQVMYSVWGGGIAGSRQTPGIRQGMFVFGFFLDVEDQQTPVIMGVLGNNAKTTLSMERNNFGPQSGFMQAEKAKKGPAAKVSVQSISLATAMLICRSAGPSGTEITLSTSGIDWKPTSAAHQLSLLSKIP